MDNFLKMGSRQQMIQFMSSCMEIDADDAEKVFDFLRGTYRGNTEEFGCITQTNSHMQALIVNDCQYYINLPKAILLIAAFLLDTHLTKGFISTTCGFLGIPTQVFFKMNQEKAEVCLLREYIRDKNKVNSADYSYLVGRECVNNDLPCHYRKEGGICHMEDSHIQSALEYFREGHIIS